MKRPLEEESNGERESDKKPDPVPPWRESKESSNQSGNTEPGAASVAATGTDDAKPEEDSTAQAKKAKMAATGTDDKPEEDSTAQAKKAKVAATGTDDDKPEEDSTAQAKAKVLRLQEHIKQLEKDYGPETEIHQRLQKDLDAAIAERDGVKPAPQAAPPSPPSPDPSDVPELPELPEPVAPGLLPPGPMKPGQISGAVIHSEPFVLGEPFVYGEPFVHGEPVVHGEPFKRVFVVPDHIQQLANFQKTEEVRKELHVSVEGDDAEICAPISSFEELGVLPEYVLQSLRTTGRQTPMPIQAQALPIILAGHDLIGIAKTGSGKTLAFLLPAIVHIEDQKPLAMWDSTPIALILAPTRELVAQIAQEAGNLCMQSSKGSHGPRGIWAQEVYGGKQRREQLMKAKGAALIAATPGRLADFVNNNDLSLDRITYLVLDEADRMLDLGFQSDVQNFSSRIRADRHSLFFSATWPKEVQELATDICLNAQQPVIIRVGQHEDGTVATRADIFQEVVVFDGDDWQQREMSKKNYLYGYLRKVLQDPGNKVLVFVSSKALADELATNLGSEGFLTDSMHGGRKQWDRDEVLSKFKGDEFRMLVATDVMGRGLDIPSITHVVIYDMGDIEDYIHRIGRTARGNTDRPGHALTLFEYNKKWPELARGLVKVLEDSQQVVPPDLVQIAEEVESGQREVVDRHNPFNKNSKKSSGKVQSAWWQQEEPGWQQGPGWQMMGPGWGPPGWPGDWWW